MSAGIRGLGLWVPPTVRRNDAWSTEFVARYADRRGDDLTRILPDADPIGALAARFAESCERDPFRGALERRVAAGVPASEGERIACEAAIADADVPRDEIDLVLGHSLVPDRLTPPNAPLVAHRLGLRAAALGVDAACASVVAQLVLACAMVEAGRARNVLLVQSHVVSPTLDYDQPASTIFGDGAAAVIVGRVADGFGLREHVASSDGSLHGAVTWERRDGVDSPWWSGGAIRPGTADRAALKCLTSRLLHLGVETMLALFDAARVGPTEIDALATIQPSAWYPSALAEAVGIPIDRAPVTFARLAHLGAAGVVANLLAARERGLVRPGALVALYAHGAGANLTAALVRWA